MINKELFVENFSFFDKEVVLEIMDIFINEYPERIKTLELNIKNKDSKSINFNAHSLKGVIANFVDEETRELAKELEFKGKDANFDGIDELFQKVKLNGEILINDLKELREKYI